MLTNLMQDYVSLAGSQIFEEIENTNIRNTGLKNLAKKAQNANTRTEQQISRKLAKRSKIRKFSSFASAHID